MDVGCPASTKNMNPSDNYQTAHDSKTAITLTNLSLFLFIYEQVVVTRVSDEARKQFEDADEDR